MTSSQVSEPGLIESLRLVRAGALLTGGAIVAIEILGVRIRREFALGAP